MNNHKCVSPEQPAWVGLGLWLIYMVGMAAAVGCLDVHKHPSHKAVAPVSSAAVVSS